MALEEVARVCVWCGIVLAIVTARHRHSIRGAGFLAGSATSRAVTLPYRTVTLPLPFLAGSATSPKP